MSQHHIKKGQHHIKNALYHIKKTVDHIINHNIEIYARVKKALGNQPPPRATEIEKAS
jgi:hypothetical protein